MAMAKSDKKQTEQPVKDAGQTTQIPSLPKEVYKPIPRFNGGCPNC